MEPLGENYREYRSDDKTKWGPGPWQDEPDKAQWIDAATGLDCLIVRNHHGSLCGYVGVPPGHLLHGAGYGIPDVEVHGGLTFAGPCDPGHDERTICHVPAPGRPDAVWWLGFDCGHAFDLQPEFNSHPIRFIPRFPDEQYRDWRYVASEVTRLAQQLHAAG